MKFNDILRQFEAALKIKYTDRLVPGIYQAINALLRCRTGAAGGLKLHCPASDDLSAAILWASQLSPMSKP
ncbi:MAG: hypothetical protein PHD43_08830 [Methylococcales bacterium]|nr:hypothetical protein [Methylococcales bacterium]